MTPQVKPDSPGFWWGWFAMLSGDAPRWHLVRVKQPLWVDPERRDLNWYYLDGSGGADFPPGSLWVNANPPPPPPE